MSDTINKILEQPDIVQKILTVRNSLYSEEGLVLKRIIFNALKNKSDRDDLVAGLKYDKCKKWIWECPKPPIGIDYIRFKYQGNLKKQIDALEASLIALGIVPDSDLSNFDPNQLDPYESYFALTNQFEPIVGDLISTLFNYYTAKSLEDLDSSELEELLKKLNAFMNDKENGVMGFIEKALPRS